MTSTLFDTLPSHPGNCTRCHHANKHTPRCGYGDCRCGQPGQPGQPGEPVARVSDPETSHQAARRAATNAATNRARVLDFLRSRGALGATDFETADAVGSQQTSAGKRRGELRDAGLVEDSGVCRPSPSGSPSIVWVAVA